MLPSICYPSKKEKIILFVYFIVIIFSLNYYLNALKNRKALPDHVDLISVMVSSEAFKQDFSL